MLALGALALAIPFLAAGSSLDVATSARSEAGGGLVPVRADQPSQPQFTGSLDLASGWRFSSERTTFAFTYGPRFFTELPNTAAVGRPLVVHQLRSNYTTALERRSSLDMTLDTSAGEATFSSIQSIVDPGTGIVTIRTVPLVAVNARSTLSHRATRLHTLGLSLQSGYTAPLGEDRLFATQQDLAAPSIPTTFRVQAAATDTLALSNRTGLRISLSGAVITTEGQPDTRIILGDRLVTYGGTATLSHALGSRASVEATLGVTRAQPLESRGANTIPILSGSHSTGWRFGHQVWSSTISAGTRGFLDRLSGAFLPQGFLGYILQGTVGRSLTAGVGAFGSTSISGSPLDPPRYESIATLDANLAYALSRSLSLTLRLRNSLRAPHLLELEALTTQPEAQGLVGLRYNIGTGETLGRWLP